SSSLNRTEDKDRNDLSLKNIYILLFKQSIARKSRFPTRWSGPSPKNRRIPRAGAIHRSETAGSHAQEGSIAQESQDPTRWRAPSPKNRRIPRAGAIHRSETAESHALEGSVG